MAEAIELAAAYVSIVPSMQGAQGTIMEQLVPGATGAGDAAGKSAGGAFGGAWKKHLGAAALVGGTVAAFKGLYEVGAVFDDVSDTIRTGTGASGEALDDLVASAKNVGKSVPAEFSAVGSVLADVNTRFGLTGDVLETVSSQYLEAGRILGEEVDIGKTSAAFNAFKIEGEGVVGAMDTLFQVSQATGLGMNELAAGASANGAAMQTLGFDFEETISLVGSLDKAGLNSTATLAAMSKGMITLAKDGEEPQDAFKRVTGEIDTLISSGDKAKAIDLASGIFGTRGAAQFVGAVESGTLALDDLVGATGATEDTILGVGEETADFAEHWQIVKNNALAALEPLGSKVFNALGDALLKVTPYLETFGNWLGDNEWAIAALGVLIGTVLVGAFIALTAPIWATTVALLASPITWIIVGIVALIAGLVLLIQNWDSVVVFLKDVWGGVVDWLAGVWDSITGALTTAWQSVASFFTGLWASITGTIKSVWNGIIKFYAGVWSKITGALTAAWQGMKNAVTTYINAIKTVITTVWNAIKGATSAVWNGIRSVITTVINTVRNVVSGGVNGVRSAITGAWNAIRNVTSGTFNGIRNVVSSAINGVVSTVRTLPGRALSALGNIGSTLLGAGKKLITGFIDGIKGAIGGVKDTLGGLTSKLTSWKGPPSKDATLLKGAGQLVIGGFIDGLESEYGAVEKSLNGLTSDVSNTRFGAPAGVAFSGGRGLARHAMVNPAGAVSLPKELVVVDADGGLVGRMRVEARSEIGSHQAASSASLRAGRR